MKLAVLLLTLAAVSADAAEKKKAPVKARNTVTLTGCVDQRGDDFVLAGDRELAKVTTLRGDGFPDDNFGRHMGHKVRVHGRPVNGEFKVSKIEHLADSCAPDSRSVK